MLKLTPPPNAKGKPAPKVTVDARRISVLNLLNIRPRTLKEIHKAVGTYRINEIMAELAAGRMIIYSQTNKVYELYNMEVM